MTWYGKIYQTLKTASQMSGLPMGNASREIASIWNNTIGASTGNLLQTYDAGDYKEIKYALKDGYLSDEEAVRYLMEQGVYDDESKARAEVYKWYIDEQGENKDSELYAPVRAYKAADADDSLSSLDKGIQKRAALTNADLSDEQRLSVYRGIDPDNNSGRADKFESVMEAGLSWAETVQAYDQWAIVNAREDLKAKEKAETFARLVEGTGYSTEQKQAIRENFKFWTNLPIEEAAIDRYIAVGFDLDASAELADRIAALEPLPGKNSVTDNQKYQAVASSSLSTEDQWKAIRALTADDYTSTHVKIDIVETYGISPSVWTASKQIMYDEDDAGDNNNQTNQAEAKAALDAMDIPTEQKAILWQLVKTGKNGWKPKSNPYNKAVGQEIYSLFEKQKAEKDAAAMEDEEQEGQASTAATTPTKSTGLVLGSANQKREIDLPEGWDQGLVPGSYKGVWK